MVLGIKDKDTFPLIFLRENCADMAIDEDDIEEAYIASSRALLITGTHFSTEYINRISNLALDRARRNDVRTVLDIDYRPVLWGLTNRGDGETRFIASDGVTAHLQTILPKFDLVIGTIEEFNIAGGSLDIMASLRAVRAVTKATLVVKRGPMGCAVIDGAIPASLDDAFNGEGVHGRGAERARRRRCVLRRASCRAGCAARTTTAARATRMRAARSSCRATAARRPCPRASSSTTSSPTPRRFRAPTRTRR